MEMMTRRRIGAGVAISACLRVVLLANGLTALDGLPTRPRHLGNDIIVSPVVPTYLCASRPATIKVPSSLSNRCGRRRTERCRKYLRT